MALEDNFFFFQTICFWRTRLSVCLFFCMTFSQMSQVTGLVFISLMISLRRICLYGSIKQYEWHNNPLVSEESYIPKFRIKSWKNANHCVSSNLNYFEKSSRVLTDNKNLVWRQLYFSGPLAVAAIGIKGSLLLGISDHLGMKATPAGWVDHLWTKAICSRYLSLY